MKVIIIDTETTGLVEPQACEIGWLELPDTLEEFRETILPDRLELMRSETNEHFISVFEQRYRPTKAIDARASQVTGIYMKDLINCPSINTFSFPETTEIIIGHNIAYDHRVLGRPDVKLICTKELAQLCFSKKDGLANHKLTTIAEWMYPEGQKLTLKAHGAIADCKLVYLILHTLACKHIGKAKTWDDLVSLCSQGKKSYEETNVVLEEVTVMPFGKHGGKRIVDIPTDYLKWLKRQELSPALERAVVKELADR